LLYYTLWIPVVLSVGILLRHLKFERATIALILAAIGFCYLHLYHSTANDCSIDIDAHKTYIRFIDTHHAIPAQREQDISAAAHLPTYYLAATAFYKLGRMTGSPDLFQIVRHLSVMLYAFYLVIAALFARRAFEKAHTPYYLTLAMIACWPIGVAISGRIHPEPFSCVGQLGIIYCLLCWVLDKRQAALANAFIFTGLLLLARNFGSYFLILAGSFLAHAVYAQGRNILTPQMLASATFALVCYGLSALHRDMFPDTAFSQLRGHPTLHDYLEVFLYFNPWQFVTDTMLSPLIGSNRIYFWHYFLRSALLGDCDWQVWPAAFALGPVWLAVVVYALYGIFYYFQRVALEEKKLLLVLMGFAGMMTGMLISARFVYMHIPGLGDVRYVFPLTALMAVGFGKTIEWHQGAGRQTAVSIGNGLALGFIMLSVGLYLGQYLIF